MLISLAEARIHGMVVSGLPADQLIGRIPRPVLCRAMAHSLSSVDPADPSYSLLNACRDLMFVRQDVLGSKLDGARWALAEGVIPPELGDVALERALGGPLLHPHPDFTRAFTEQVRQELEAVASSD